MLRDGWGCLGPDRFTAVNINPIIDINYFDLSGSLHSPTCWWKYYDWHPVVVVSGVCFEELQDHGKNVG